MPSHPSAADKHALRLPYQAPYDWPRILAFMQGRAIPGVEEVDAQTYRRVIDLGDGASGALDIDLLEVSHLPEEHALLVNLHRARPSQQPTLTARVRRMFDLDADPVAIEAALSRDGRLAPIVAAQSGLRVPGAWDAFETAVRAILGQQITVTGATRLAGQLVALMGQPLAKPWPAHPRLTHAFPRPEAFSAQGLAPLGMPSARRAALLSLAQRVAAEPELLTPGISLESSIATLCALPGIGDWTAHYIAMRALRESDAFPAGDVGLQRAMAVDGVRPNARALLAHAEQWRPWRSYAVLHLWSSESPAT